MTDKNPDSAQSCEDGALEDYSAALHSQAHDRLAHQSRVVLRLGQMLLASGASAYRVKASMATVAKAVGIAEHQAQVTFTEIIATSYANGTFRTGLAEQRTMGINADRIDRVAAVQHLDECCDV